MSLQVARAGNAVSHYAAQGSPVLPSIFQGMLRPRDLLSSPRVSHSDVRIVAASVFNQRFHQVEDVEPDEFFVVDFGVKAVMTTRCATCLGVVAKAFSSRRIADDEQPVRVGVHHLQTGNGISEFLEAMAIEGADMKRRGSKITKIFLYIYGGYKNASTNPYYKELLDKIDAFSNNEDGRAEIAEIKKVHVNPWGFEGNWGRYEKQIGQLELFALDIGIDAKGQVFVGYPENAIVPTEAYSQYPTMKKTLQAMLERDEQAKKARRPKRRIEEKEAAEADTGTQPEKKSK